MQIRQRSVWDRILEREPPDGAHRISSVRAAGSRGIPCIQPGPFVGMFGRTIKTGVAFRKVTDGLSKTFMVGETLPAHSQNNCVFCNNFPLSSTHIPINTKGPGNEDTVEPQVRYVYRSGGFKSVASGGCQYVDGGCAVISVFRRDRLLCVQRLWHDRGGRDVDAVAMIGARLDHATLWLREDQEESWRGRY